MPNTITLIPSEIINTQNNELVTTSLMVAEKFKKRHDNILRKIDEIASQVPEEFYLLNFEGVKYTDKKGEKRTMFNITKDGFVLLVMGFTGKLAMQIKIAYIEAFNFMADKLYPEQPKLNSTLTEDQIGHVYNSVHAGCANVAKYDRSKYFAEVWGSVKRQFKVASYREVKATDYPALCDFIGVPPIRELIHGELLPKSEPVAASQSKGIAMLEFGGMVERVQKEEIWRLHKQLSEMQHTLSNIMACNGAVSDGYHESWGFFSFPKKDREKGQKKAVTMFNNWKMSKRIF